MTTATAATTRHRRPVARMPVYMARDEPGHHQDTQKESCQHQAHTAEVSREFHADKNNLSITPCQVLIPGVLIPGPPGALYTCGPYNFGPASGPLGPFGGLFTTTLTFAFSGGGDVAALTGYCEITPAPVPPTMLLFGGGLLELVGLRLRKK